MVADCDYGGLYHAYKASNINYEVNSDEYCESQNSLTEEQINKIKYFTDLYKLNEFDALSNNKNKIPSVSSNVRDIPLIYKGNKDLFYLKPLKKIDFIKQDKPVLKIKRIIKAENNTNNIPKPIIITKPIQDNNYMLYGIIFLVIICLIGLLVVIMR